MRIGLVLYGPLDKKAGGVVYASRLVEYLRAQGDVVEVVSLPWRGYARAVALNWSRELRSKLERGRFDVLLQDEFTHISLFRLNRELRTPKVAVVHHLLSDEDTYPGQRWLYHWAERAYLRTVGGFIFNSESTATRVRRELSAAPLSVVAYPAGDRFEAGINAGEIEARAMEHGPLRVLYVGSVVRRKRLDVLLRGLAALPAETWTLDVSGDESEAPRYAGRLRRRTREAGIEERVRLQGVVSDDRLAELYRSSQLLAVPSAHEGFGMAYVEGMGFGLPAIASARGGAAELVKDGRNGYLVAPDDAAAIAHYVSRLASDRRLLAEMSLAALETARCWPSWQESAGRIRAFLHDVVS